MESRQYIPVRSQWSDSAVNAKAERRTWPKPLPDTEDRDCSSASDTCTSRMSRSLSNSRGIAEGSTLEIQTRKRSKYSRIQHCIYILDSNMVIYMLLYWGQGHLFWGQGFHMI